MLLNTLNYGSPQSRLLYYFAGIKFSLLRDPVDRFTSLFTYLKTASWEPTYNPTNLTLNEYILTGEYKKSKDNGNWMVRTLSKCGNSNINSTTEEDLEVAKVVLSSMLVGFTNNIKEFFDRLQFAKNDVKTVFKQT